MRVLALQWIYAKAWGEKEPPYDPASDEARPVIDVTKLTAEQRQLLRELLTAATAVRGMRRRITPGSTEGLYSILYK